MIKLKTYQKIFLFSILVVASIAIFDILSLNSGIFGNSQDYIFGNFTEGWWNLFFQFNVILIGLVSLAYYFFGKQDKSEAISLGISSFLLWMYFGIADILFFLFQKLPVPNKLPWLNHNFILLNISKLLGFEVVISSSLYIGGAIGLFLVYNLNKIMVEKL